MFPVALNLAVVPVLLVGRGELLARRRAQLEEAGAQALTVREAASVTQEQLAAHRVVMVAGLSREESKTIADAARAAGRLVNVEDVNALCDFYFTASIRRGDLLIAVSTGGASPTLARRVRDKIAALFGAEWKMRMEEIAAFRRQWKQEGKSMPEIARLTEARLAEKGWL